VAQFTEQDGRRLAEHLVDGEVVLQVVEADARPSSSQLLRRLAIVAAVTAVGGLLIAATVSDVTSNAYVGLVVLSLFVAWFKRAGPVRIVAITSRRFLVVRPAWPALEIAVAHGEVPVPEFHAGGEVPPWMRLRLGHLTLDVRRPHDLQAAVAFDEFVAHCSQLLPTALPPR
jgi:hypothetical protein